ncbi:MAG: hypothetical protein ABWZ88_04750 [Variovorax sp.]
MTTTGGGVTTAGASSFLLHALSAVTAANEASKTVFFMKSPLDGWSKKF